MKGRIVIDGELCKGCGLCVHFCPRSAVVLSRKINAKGYVYAEPDAKKGCTGCAVCALMCPEAAIEVSRE
ncbi:MAG: 4Fe-4S binding protein [Desulfobacterota bacterium]|nr:4Fe-4S binding protein [Thermodesulfobacteriota bacterium]